MTQDIFDTTPEDLRASMLVATSTDPEAHAKVVNLANKLQLPPELVARNPQWAQHQSDLMLDAEKLTKDYPGTAKFLSDPNRAAVSRDEIIQQMALEDTVRNAQLLEPGLFGKDVRDAIAKQLREKGHKVEIVDGSRPVSEWFPTLDFTAGQEVDYSTPGEVQALQGVGGMGITNPAQDAQDEQSQKMDQKAVQLYSTPQGFWERMITGAANMEPVPFVGAGKEMVDVYALTQLANRVKDGTADDNDWIELLKYDNEIRRGTDFGGKVAAVLVNLPAFAGEIAATGGLYTTGSQAARNAGLYAAKKILNKSARDVAESAVLRGVVKTAGWVAGSAVQATVGMPHRVAVDAMKRMVPQLSSMSVNEQGELEKLVLDSEDEFASAIGKAILNQSIEVGTESAGAFIGKVTGLEALKSAVVTKWFKLNPTKGWSQFSALLRKAKWDGVLEEFGEERLGEILRAFTGLESMKLDPEQYAVELVSFAALPMAGAAVYGPGMVRQSRQLAERAQTQVEFFRDLGAQSSESKTRTRVPGMLGALGDLAAQNGPVERVFAPIAAWDQYFASKGIDPRQVAQETLGETESYDKAREAGHDLEIPIGAYTEKLAPTEHNESLAQVLRLGSVDAPNVVEMQAGLQATQASVEEMLKLNQDYTALSTEKQTLATEITTLQEQVSALQAQSEQRTARMQEIQSQLQTQAPQALQEILAGNTPAAAELQGLAQEYQALAQQDQQAQQAGARIEAISARQQEIDKEIARIEKRNAEARRSAPGQAPEVVDMANEVYTQLMATKNTSDSVARAHANMFARMAYIMANRSGMSLQQFKDRFVTQILGSTKNNAAAPAGVTMSQEEQQRDAAYMAAVESGDIETAQRLVDEAAKAAGYTTKVFHGTDADFTVPNMPLFLGDEDTADAYAKDRAAAFGDDVKPMVYRFYARFANTASEEDVKQVAKELGLEVENDMAFSVLDPQISPGKAPRVVDELKRKGYDSAQIDDFVVGNTTDVVQSFVAFDARQLKSAEPVTRDADGNVIPLSERFDEGQNSILYQKAPTEDVLADAPTITLQDLVGRAVFPIIADLTSAGVMYTGVDSTQIAVPIYTQGGPKFPLLPENQQAGVAWASQGTHIANSKAKLAGQSVLGVVVAMSQEAHRSNATVISAILATVQAYVEAGRMTNEQVAALDELIRVQGPIAEKKAMDEAQSDLAKAQSKLKKAKTEKDINAANKAIAEAQAKVEDANPGDKSLSKWPGFGDAQAASEFIDRNKTTFGQRQRLADVIALKEAQALGTPNVEAILNELRDKDYDNMEWGDSIMVIEFDKNDSLVRLGTDGTKEHMSYEWGIRGKVVGKLARPVNYTLIWDDFFKERRAQHSMFMEAARKEAKRLKKDFLNLTDEEFKKIKKTLEEKQELKPALEGGDRRSFELGKPVQVITQEIADRIPQTPHTAIKSPKHAQLVNAFLNDKWMSTDVAVNAGGLGPAAFLNALAADPNKVLLDEYTLQSIKKAKKESGLRIFQLGEPRDMPGVKKENTSKVFFGLKNGDPASAYGLDPAAYKFGPNEKMLTLVLNGERKAPGMAAAIMIKALEEGATSLDCYAVPSKKYPDGFLPSLYKQFGFEVVGTIPFSEEYHSATKLADMKKLWKDAGWDESLGYPPIALMKWRGTDEQRKGLKDRYIEESTASILKGRTEQSDSAAGESVVLDARQGDAGEGARPDGGGDTGVQGTAVRPSDYPQGLANAVAELRQLTPLELQNLGILSASQAEEAIRKAKEEAENQPVFPEITLNQTAVPAGMSAKQIADWAAEHSIEEVRQKLKSFRLTPTQTMLEMLGSFPEYLKPVVDFVMAQRQKLVDGNISAREVAKAYFITLSSIGADAINVTTIAQKADEIGMEFNPDPMFLSKGSKGQDRMRPEELAAWWFSTDMGQRALNAIEKGEIDREAWEQGLAIRDAFGRNDAREKRTKSGSYVPGMLGEKRKKKNLNDILEITKLINGTKGNSNKLEKVLNGIQGVGNGKKGFVGHMLGMGDVATIDAVEMNVWLTGKGDTTRADEEMKKRVALAKKGGTKVSDFYERIRSRIAEIHKKTKSETGIPDEVAAHIIHHWIWDKAKGAETTHAGVYEAMRFYQNVDYRPGVLTEAAQKFKAGEITREEYNRIAAVELPLTPFKSVPKPATMDEVRTGLGEYKAGTRLKRDMAQAPEDIPAQTLESRLDIPAYREKGVWVVTLHEDRGDKSKGNAASPIAYTSTAMLNNVTFKVHEAAALNIATGKPKGTIATMRGDYQPMTADEAQALAEQAMQDGWVQVGMNPLRHSFFYDKADERPVVSAEQVLQIGGLVLAKNPVYGNTADYLFQNENNARGSISFSPAQRGAPRREFTIRMLGKANASTFMHEAAHFYLEVFNDLANQADAPQALREDWDRISKWLGLQAGVPITVDQHETFARGFERYLMEGKAPAEEVRGFFASMRTWLVRIYRDLMNLNVDISDDIRGVFDRMVATDVEIEAAQQREKVEPMFGTKPDGMDEAAWERYRKAVESASLQARERLQTELEREMLKAKSDERKAEIARVTQTVRSELAATREHIALAILRSGKMPDDEPIPEPLMPMKLDRDSLLSAGFDKDTIDALRKLGVYRVEDGVSVDVAAEVLGFGSADELVQALVSTPSFDKAVKEETKRRVDASHPSIMEDSQELKRAASDAVRNDKRDEVIAVEVEELQRLIRADKQAAGRVADLAPAPLGAIARRILRNGPEQANAARILLDNSKVTVDFIKAMATKVAQEQLQGMKLRDIRPSLYLAAARAAGARASRLAAAGDFQGALGQKESELLNHILYRESRDMQKVAQKQQRYLLRMTEDAARERLGKANPSYREQVDGILERFNFVPIPLSQVDRRTRLAEWISAQESKGLTVDIDETVRDEAFRKDFREMTAIELTAVWEAVKQIDHLAKTTTRLLTLQDEREFRAVVQDLVAQITANTKAKPRGFGSKTSGEKIAEGWDSFFAAHRKLASLVREMDGFVDAGPVYNAIMAPINDAGDNEAVETEKATEAIQKLFKVFEKDELKRMTRKQVVRGATKNFNLSREDVLSIALNWGNEDNRQKLVDGYNGLTEQDVIAILDTMTEKEWKFVQSVWDYIDSFWPRIRDKQERVYGIPPDKIEPTPVVTKFGVFKGGYYPLKYAGARAEGESDADAAKMMMRGAVTSSTTRRGHTKERVAGVERPVRLDLGVLTEHVTQVVHDLTHHEMLVDVNRILRNRSVMEAIEEHYGEPVYRQLRKALEAIAVGNTNSEDRFTRALGHIRTGASVAGLGFNLMTSMLQAFGLTNAIPRVGVVNMAKAVGRWIGSSKDMEDSIAWIYERSDMMRLRGKTMNRELNEIRNTVDPKFQTALMDSYFYLIQKGQMLADVPTWLGAYHRAMDAKSSEDEAVRIADQTVIDTQGSGMVKDLANVQRGGPLLKMWTTFYSYFNALWNLNVETVKRTNFKSPTDMGRMMVDLLILNSLPVAIQYALVTAMRGGAGGDDDEWYKALAKQQMSYLLAQLVFVRELGGIMDGRNYEGPAGGRFFAESYKLAKQVEQGELDRGFWVSANKVGGILFHYPAVQAQRTVEGMKSLWEGKTFNPAVLIVGPSREER